MSGEDPALSLSRVLVDECVEHFSETLPDDIAAGSGDSPEYMAKVYAYLNGRDRWALCLSGGGIRSATFGLGLLQGLARKNLLARFDYLSTVSGGGYIGAWLSAWAHRGKPGGGAVGIDAVQQELARAGAGAPEPPELRHLRNYSNYLTPKLGLMSADTWTGIGVYLRNLLLLWLMLIPLFVLPMFPAYFGLQVLRGEASAAQAWIAFACGAVALIWASGFLSFNLPSARAWPLVRHLNQINEAGEIGAIQGRTQAEYLAYCLVPSVFAAGCLSLALAWFWQQPDPRNEPGLFGEMLRCLFGALPRDDRPGLPATGAWMWQVPVLALLGALARMLAWAIALWRVWLINRKIAAFKAAHGAGNPAMANLQGSHALSPATALWELAAAAIAGAVGGALIGISVTQFLGDPSATGPVFGTTLGPVAHTAVYLCVAVPLFLLSFLVAESLFIGLTAYLTRDEDREWWGRAGGWTLIAALGWLAFHLLVIFGPVAIEWLNREVAPAALEKFGGLPGLLSLASGAVTAVLGASPKTPSAAGKAQSGAAGMLRGLLLAGAASLFLVTLLAGLAWLLSQVLFWVSGGSDLLSCTYGPRSTCTLLGEYVRRSGELEWSAAVVLAEQQVADWHALLIGLIGLTAIGALVWRSVNVNRFSLHATYRDRLIRCYLGAARGNGNGGAGRARLRYPDRFTGFDPNDNLLMHELHSKTPAGAGHVRAPLHIVNIAANLVNEKMLGWQQRKAASFTVSPLHAGSEVFGYRPAKHYGGDDGMSLGTAMAVSGAAASPNMGYHSSPIVTLILALFNVRLGWWLGNPRRAERTLAGPPLYRRAGPVWAAAPLIAECFGLTNSTSRFVYLSDGGHFENLGLYEMVRRRCRHIVVSDAGYDPTNAFADLGNAIRKIRVDFGIDIQMTAMFQQPRGADYVPGKPRDGFYCGIGAIRYPEGEPGTLIYIKPGLYGGEPQDVVNYGCENAGFPHEPTSDQWFSESQFESYRRLGEYIAGRVFDEINLDTMIEAEALAEAVTKAAKRA